MYIIRYTKQAQKDAKKIARAGLNMFVIARKLRSNCTYAIQLKNANF